MPNNNDSLQTEVCKKEITPYDPKINLTVSAAVYEVGGDKPVDVILSDQDWYVEIVWTLEGPLVDHLCGYFCPRLHIECYGLATEKTYAPEYNEPEGYNLDVNKDGLVAMNPCKFHSGYAQYSVRIYVDHDDIKPATADAGLDCGTMCCLGITLQSRDLCNRPGHINVVCEGPCIGFFEASHEEPETVGEPAAEGNG